MTIYDTLAKQPEIDRNFRKIVKMDCAFMGRFTLTSTSMVNQIRKGQLFQDLLSKCGLECLNPKNSTRNRELEMVEVFSKY